MVALSISRAWAAWILLFTMTLAGSATGQSLDEMREQELPQSPLRVTGTVKGPTGPAEGVRVELELRDMRRRAPEYFTSTRTDTEGVFTFDLGNFDFPQYGLQFNTVSPRYIETIRIVKAAKSELPLHVELEVKPGTLARGSVTDPEGKPIADVFISAYDVRAQQSTEEGKWEVFGIPTGQYQLRFSKEGYADSYLPVNSNGPEVIEGLEVTMSSARQLQGAVKNWAGDPVPFALIYLRDGERYLQATTDEQGAFVMKGVPENIEGMLVAALAGGYLPTEREITEQEAQAAHVDFTINHGVTIEGTVLLPSGKPASGATVIAGRFTGSSVPQTRADSKGYWRIGPFPPGEEEIFTALPPNMKESWGIADLLIQEGPTENQFNGFVEIWPKGFSSDFSIKRDGNKIRMIRRDEGEGGYAAEVIYTGEQNPESMQFEGTVEIPDLEQSGTFTLIPRSFVPGSMVGEWELREEIGASQLAVAPVQKAITTPIITGTYRTELALDKALKISGKAMREDGTPFLDGTVVMEAWNETGVYSPTAEIGIAGRFEFNRVPEGTFRLRAMSNDREHMTDAVLARGGIDGVVLYEGEPPADPVDE